MSIPLRMTIGLVMVTVSTILLASMFGILEDANVLRLKRRTSLCESLAINCSLLARENDTKAIATNIRLLSERNPDIQSAALRKSGGGVVYQYGDHERNWHVKKNAKNGKVVSTHDNIYVPILNQSRIWGTVEVAFQNPNSSGWRDYLQLNRFPILALTVFCGLLNGAAIYWYLRRTLSYLDPSKSVPDRVKTALDTLAEGLVVLDNDYRIVLANKSFAEKLNVEPEQLQGQNVDELDWWQASKDAIEMPWKHSARTQERQVGARIGLRTPVEGDRVYSVNATPIYDETGQARGVLASFDDITDTEGKKLAMESMLNELRRSRSQIQDRNRELRLLATRDSLTGCLNRRTFFESFERLWASSERHKRPLCCAMLDIDFFKLINDNYGHATGDAVLRSVSRIVNDACRKSDLFCRYGGEEFCVTMPETTMEDAVVLLERIRLQIEAADFEVEGLKVTISTGVSSSQLGAADPEAILDEADKALYIAKRSGRNRVCRWDDVADEEEILQVELPVHEEVEPDAEGSVPYRAVTTLLAALGARDPDTAAHSTRVAELCVAVARGLMSVRDSYLLEISALLHDIGKIGVPDSILLKAGALNEQEWKVMAIHDQIGVDIVEASFDNQKIVELIQGHRLPYDHREKDVPCGDDIPIGARILSICDAFDSMVSKRKYREGMPKEEAFAELERCSGKQFDPRLVGRFIAIVDDFEHSASVQVNSKHAAIQLGLHMEQLAVALDSNDCNLISKLASRLQASAAKNDIPSIENRARELVEVVSTDPDSSNLATITRELMDLCRSAQRCHIDVTRVDDSVTDDVLTEVATESDSLPQS